MLIEEHIKGTLSIPVHEGDSYRITQHSFTEDRLKGCGTYNQVQDACYIHKRGSRIMICKHSMKLEEKPSSFGCFWTIYEGRLCSYNISKEWSYDKT